MDCALSVEQVGTGEEVLVCHRLGMACKSFASTYCNISVETSCAAAAAAAAAAVAAAAAAAAAAALSRGTI